MCVYCVIYHVGAQVFGPFGLCLSLLILKPEEVVLFCL